jgi:predicted kinase
VPVPLTTVGTLWTSRGQSEGSRPGIDPRPPGVAHHVASVGGPILEIGSLNIQERPWTSCTHSEPVDFGDSARCLRSTPSPAFSPTRFWCVARPCRAFADPCVVVESADKSRNRPRWLDSRQRTAPGHVGQLPRPRWFVFFGEPGGPRMPDGARLSTHITDVRAEKSFALSWSGCEHRRVTASAVLYLTVGLPGAGKTTLARRIADDQRILRLTPDEWMAPLFEDNDAGGRRDILEGRLVWVAHQVLVSGSSVVLDFGCWSAEERYAIRAIAESVGARFNLQYVSIDEQERRARAAARWESAPETTFPMSDADHDRFLALYQPPSEAELSNAPIPEVPSGFENWFHWASDRWPSLPRLDPV